MLEKILIFIVFLFPLILFHELGHFIFAKIFGVRVEVFSIGFGPKLFKFKRRFTEYAVSLIPLGGYIKMFGDDPLAKETIPLADRDGAFTCKGKWARFWIIFGGPLANIIFAWALIFGVLLSGEQIHEIRFGAISSKTMLHQKGLKSGDVLQKINENEVTGLSDFSPDEEGLIKTITIFRRDESKVISLDMSIADFFREFTENLPVLRRPLLVNISNKEYIMSLSPNSFDWNISIEEMIDRDTSGPLYLHAVQKTLEGYVSLKSDVPLQVMFQGETWEKSMMDLALKGFRSSDLQIESVSMKSPADKAGLRGGDILVSVDGQPLIGFEDLRSRIQAAAGPVRIGYLRSGILGFLEITPEEQKMSGQVIKTVGVYRGGEFIPPRFIEHKSQNLWNSVTEASSETWGMMVKTVVGFKMLITGKMSFKNIGGPIAIGKVAADSLEVGIAYFLRLMALISVNLAIINLFPIPVLDGGHILFIGVEIANRGPLSRRKIELAQQFGMAILLLLIIMALFNDLSRFL